MSSHWYCNAIVVCLPCNDIAVFKFFVVAHFEVTDGGSCTLDGKFWSYSSEFHYLFHLSINLWITSEILFSAVDKFSGSNCGCTERCVGILISILFFFFFKISNDLVGLILTNYWKIYSSYSIYFIHKLSFCLLFPSLLFWTVKIAGGRGPHALMAFISRLQFFSSDNNVRVDTSLRVCFFYWMIPNLFLLFCNQLFEK